ncbi:MAG TPA: PRC and DUF2382 domain-containing protein [Thermoleophilaceae bacterium]|jgi:uncharacterized protein (TIGR02271 family)
MTTSTQTDVYSWRGRTVVDRDGDKIGKLGEIYLDEQTGRPEWPLVNTGMFGSKSSFVPLAGATEADGDVRLHFEKAQVKDAPNVDEGEQLSREEEQKLYSHYGLDYGEAHSEGGLPEGGAGGEAGGPGHDTSGPNTDDAMTRSEEEVAVGITQRESGRVRLKKYVVTEEVQQTVPVQREEVRIEREPVTEANAGQALDGPAISEEEHEVVLHEEQPVVEKQTVPKERVRLGKDTVTDEQTVSEEVRKERIDVEGDGR